MRSDAAEGEEASTAALTVDPSKTGWISVLLLLLLALTLFYLIGAHSLVAYLAEAQPETALKLRNDATANLNSVERVLDAKIKEAPTTQPAAPPPTDRQSDMARLQKLAEVGAKTRPSPASDPQNAARDQYDYASLRRRVIDALSRDPLDARGLRLLGQLGDGREGRPEVANLMRMAVARDIHETRAVYWLMVTSLEAGSVHDAISYADIILRTQSRLGDLAVRTLARASETPEGLSEVTRLVLSNPPWRRAFFQTFTRNVTDGRIPLQLLLALKETAYPPTNGEIMGFMSVLLDNRLFELAYYTWLQFLPPGQLALVTSPFNGSFEQMPSGLPFDWQMPASGSVVTQIVAKPGASQEKALSVEFGIGRVNFTGVSQWILLPPGAYQFRASFHGVVTGKRGLVWSVTCSQGKELGRTPMMLGTNPSWTQVEFTFTVPDRDCPAQTLRLFHDARSASEQFVSGRTYHDEVTITPVTSSEDRNAGPGQPN